MKRGLKVVFRNLHDQQPESQSRWKEDWKKASQVRYCSLLSSVSMKRGLKVVFLLPSMISRFAWVSMKRGLKGTRVLRTGVGAIASRWKEDWKSKTSSHRVLWVIPSRWKEDWKSVASPTPAPRPYWVSMKRGLKVAPTLTVGAMPIRVSMKRGLKVIAGVESRRRSRVCLDEKRIESTSPPMTALRPL